MADFEGKVVIVTGAARGQGREIAHAFARQGAQVALCDIGRRDLASVDYPLASEDELAGVLADFPSGLGATCDVSKQSDVAEFVGTVLDRFGRVDILVNNAGILSGNQPAHTLSDTQWDTMISVNLTGVWRMSRAVVPQMIERGGGRIVNIASAAGLVGAPGFGHYCAAKHGVVGLTKTMAAELAPHGITVNAVCPGLVDTKMVEHSASALASKMGTSSDEAYDLFLTTHLIKERVTPAQSAAAVLYLASENARTVTGACLPVDGGWVAV